MFQRVVMMDYSASSTAKQGRDSLWVASRDHDGARTLCNPRTRDEAWAQVRGLCAGVGPVLVGVDVAFGAPEGLCARLGVDGWRGLWGLVRRAVVDGPDQRNNRFDVAAALNRLTTGERGPFWGCPASKEQATLGARRADVPGMSPWRRVDDALRGDGLRPFSVYQTAYAGSVGGQSLLAWPRMAAWRDADPRVRVWPFSTGLCADPTGGDPDAIVLAEVWPSADPRPLPGLAVRDAEQVEALCERFAAADAAGALAGWFTPARALAAREVVEREEGWVLGVG